MSKFLFVVLACILIVGLAINGCATPTPTPAVKPSPVPSPVQTAAASVPSPTQAAAVPVSPAKPSPAPQKTWKLKFNYMNPPTGVNTEFGHNPWAQDVEKATNGRVKVDQYNSDTLMKSINAPEGIKSGIAQVAWLFTGYFPGQFEPFDVITLPFIAPTGEIASRVIWALYNKFPELQDNTKDFKVLTVWTSAPYNLLTTKKQVKAVEDIRGLKIRATGGPPTEMTKLLGAIPLLVPQAEVYINLQKGVIDGAWNPAEPILSYRYYELAKYYTLVPTVTTVFMLIMNKEAWNEMPKDIQDAIMSVSGEYQSIRYGGGVFDRSEVLLRDTVKKAGFEMVEYAPSPEEMAKWTAAAGKPIWNSWVKSMEAKKIPGQKMVDEALRLVETYSKDKPKWPTLGAK